VTFGTPSGRTGLVPIHFVGFVISFMSALSIV
jgi:hypothetical protein